MANAKIVLYGAYGYTGELIARKAAAEKLPVLLAGRDASRLQVLANELNLQWQTCSLDDPEKLHNLIDNATLVIHAAGPFSRTAAPMVSACLRTGTHYVDITGEIEVFEYCAGRDSEAKDKGIMLLPGGGFDVVPSDCLAAWLSQAMPDACALELAFLGLGGGISHGTATTMVENLHRGGAIRRNGQIQSVRTAWRSRTVSFTEGRQTVVTSIPWGDVSTAWHSTQIPNITVYTVLPALLRKAAPLLAPFLPFASSSAVQNFLKRRINTSVTGPSAATRANGRSLLWGQVRNAQGDTIQARMQTAEGYELTARSVLLIARRILSGDWKAGYLTPSLAYSADFILELPPVERMLVHS